MKKSILILDIDTSMSESLIRDGFLIYETNNCKDALKVLDDHKIDLVLMDTKLQGDDWRLLKSILTYSIPVLIHTANTCNNHKLQCFWFGVDDYILKPADELELSARIRVALRRHRPKVNSLIRVGHLSLNKNSREVYIGKERLMFSRREYDLLEHLMLNQNIVFTRESLLDTVWGYDYEGETRTVDSHIKKIRDKIDPSSQLIKTVWGKGYKFESG
ncbi:response regulator transcription factor [Acidaminobacter sp. JC074]|uniref:response regulator transcription factor n=1 Tax=Acidaminobacter sp. JC074 TaxID=2530199 RepID=UPI001F0ED07D|nr:response regulator transcription factor [Acidaminobacter sp. JC074]MCH4887441.1 response regulator transcription factor [Acidaminobacter sp. JC074]